ncbi:cytochrome P450 [Aeromicrobium terrae]|uniref:Cytochrome P450 n=1 Tax=Aeromicrobium terrae TaxID=2498846 RepID=A0A5C8NMX1_9ACTN|nr:cytochrome P450 [Aeromicrobium terrae]TXL63079.1 cytochrome P450 [Aeromicrobium terrae]
MTATTPDHVPSYIADWPPVPKGPLPPGPRWPALVQSLAFMRYRHSFIPWLHRKYGDVFTVKLIPDGRQIVMFSRPEHIKEIFAGDPEVFYAGKGNAVLGAIMGEHSLLLVDSAEHKRARKLLMPAFSPRALKGYEDMVVDIARSEVESWRDGTTFRSLDRMNAVTLEVIMKVVFGLTDETRLRELRPLLRGVINVSPAVLIGIGYPWLMKYGMWKRFVDNRDELDRALYRLIAERRAEPDLASRTDVLSQLILVGDDEDEVPLNDAELRDQLVTLLLAGHETTATALAWTLHELGRSREHLARARKAADEGDDAYLEAVLKESMRLHPVIPMVVRLLMQPATIGGTEIPAGASVAPSIILSHQENFADPDVFRPARFLDEKVQANTWIPFGGGVRRCIGAGFSLMEGVAVLREMLQRFDVVADEPDVPKVRNITSVPRHGSRITVRAR